MLVVEDDETTLFLYNKFLRDSEFQLVVARTIWQARDVLQHLRPQAILLDMMFPGEDAWPLLTELKGDEETRDIPVVVITTNQDQRKGLALGADAYYIKPLERTRLLATLRRLTAQKPPEESMVVSLR